MKISATKTQTEVHITLALTPADAEERLLFLDSRIVGMERQIEQINAQMDPMKQERAQLEMALGNTVQGIIAARREAEVAARQAAQQQTQAPTNTPANQTRSVEVNQTY